MAAPAIIRDSNPKDEADEGVILDLRPVLRQMSRNQEARVEDVLNPSEHGQLAEVAESLNFDAERGYYGGKAGDQFAFSMGETYLMPWAIGDHYDNARRIVDRLNKEDPTLGDDETIRTRMMYVFGPHLEEGSFTSPRLVFSRLGRITENSDMRGRKLVTEEEGLEDLNSQIKGDDIIREFNVTGQRLLTRFAPGEPLVEIDLFRGLTADKRFNPDALEKEAITYSVLQLACKMAPSYVSGVYNPETQVSDEEFFADIARHVAQRFAQYPDEKPLSHKHDLDKRRAFLAKETYANISTIFLPTKLEPGGELDPHELDHLKDDDGLFREVQSRKDPGKQKKLYREGLPAYHGLEDMKGQGWAMVEYVGEPEGVNALDAGSNLTLKEQLYNFTARCANWHLMHPNRHVEARHFMRVDVKDPGSSHTHYRWMMLVRYTNKDSNSLGHTRANDITNLRRVPKDMLQYLDVHDPYFGKTFENPHHHSTNGSVIDHNKNKIEQRTRVGRFFAHQKSEWVQLTQDCKEAINFWNSDDAFVPIAEMHRRIFRDSELSDREKKAKWLRYTQLASISDAYAHQEIDHLFSIVCTGSEKEVVDSLAEYFAIEDDVRHQAGIADNDTLLAILKKMDIVPVVLPKKTSEAKGILLEEIENLLQAGEGRRLRALLYGKEKEIPPLIDGGASVLTRYLGASEGLEETSDSEVLRLERLLKATQTSNIRALNILAKYGLVDRKIDQFIAEKMKPVLPFLCDQEHLNDLSAAAKEDDNDPTLPYVLESTDGAMMEFQARNFYPGILGAVATDGRGAATLEFDMPMHDFDVAWPTRYKWSDQKNNFELIKGLVNRSILRPQDKITRCHFACTPYAELYGVESPTPYVRYMVPLQFEDTNVTSKKEAAPDFYEVGWNGYHWMNNLDARSARFAPIGSVYSRDNRQQSGLIEAEPQAFRYKRRREETGLLEVPRSSDSLAASYNYAEGLTELGIVEPGKRWGNMFRRKVPGIDPHHSPRGWNFEDAKERANWFEYRSGKHVYNGKRLARAEIRDGEWRMSWGPNLGAGSEEAAFMFEYYGKIKIVDDKIDENTIVNP